MRAARWRDVGESERDRIAKVGERSEAHRQVKDRFRSEAALNVSALLAEVAAREAKFAAAEAYFEKYGIPPLSTKALARIEAEWRGEGTLKKKPRSAA